MRKSSAIRSTVSSRHPHPGAVVVAIIALVVLVSLLGHGARSGTAPVAATSAPSATARPGAVRSSAAAAEPRPGTALAALASLPVKGRAPMTSYSRDQFGPAWADVDGNGCDTRDDVLARDMRQVRRAADGCEVTHGVLVSPYSGETLRKPHAPGTELIDIDHVVALGDAWQTGARRIAFSAREELANDPLNLIAVDASSNRQKGDADAASWLPANKAERCDYVARQVAVKRKYRLWTTPAEHAAIGRVLRACPREALPTDATLPTPPPGGAAASPAPTRRESAAAPGPSAFYANCAAVRRAGAAPLRRGQAGYRAGLDRDGDGVACESR